MKEQIQECQECGNPFYNPIKARYPICENCNKEFITLKKKKTIAWA